MISITEKYNILKSYDEYMSDNRSFEKKFKSIFFILYILIGLTLLLYLDKKIYLFLICRINSPFWFNYVEEIFNKSNSLYFITLNIFTFTSCSFLLRDDTTLGLSIYEIINWKFPFYRFARINSMVSPVIVLFFITCNFKYCIYIYIIQLY